eukprot:298332-Chlamydomonas_euryale.AAC.5
MHACKGNSSSSHAAMFHPSIHPVLYECLMDSHVIMNQERKAHKKTNGHPSLISFEGLASPGACSSLVAHQNQALEHVAVCWPTRGKPRSMLESGGPPDRQAPEHARV